MASTTLNLGFLTVMQEGTGYLGGYLVTNGWGRPLEFRLSSAVQPNKVQQILYAATLAPYICGELIGKTLFDKAGIPVQYVITTCEHALDLRLKIEAPVAWLVSSDQGNRTEAPHLVLPQTTHLLVAHRDYPGDIALLEQLLDQLGGNFDLTEPFGRIREAIAEARKMGVAGRAAA